MVRKLQRLSAKTVEKLRTPGYYADGGNLWLQVSPVSTKSWIFRFTLSGRSREMGLGSLNAVSLAKAREKAAAYRALLADGVDPIDARDGKRTQEKLAKARRRTFDSCAEGYIKAHRAKWGSRKHAEQWTNTLKTYCGEVIGNLPIADIDTGLVLRCLEPIWTEKHETATRVRQRIESVLDWARARHYRTGDNPARWKGHLDKILPSIPKRKRVKHYPALAYEEMPGFMRDLRGQAGTAARALEFVILTAARTSEVIGAQPGEFNLENAVWTIPAARMKGGREHRVPLSPSTVTLVRAQLELGGQYLFPGLKKSAHLSNMAMLKLLERMGRTDLTVHGFRSSFRDWSAETTGYPREVAEMALAHAVSDEVEAAYRRGDLFEKRRRLMADWAKHCERAQKGDVVPLKKKAV